MATVTVVLKSPANRGGTLLKKGDEIEVDSFEADELVAAGIAKIKGESKAEASQPESPTS